MRECCEYSKNTTFDRQTFMAHSAALDRPAPLTPIQWTICAVAALGFAFDIYELLMLPLIVRPALLELLGIAPGSPEVNAWV